jgi:hypothetical protein
LNNKLQFDIALYHFKLNNAIVRRNNLAGEEYFINSGQTLQKGIETSIQYKVFSSKTTFIQSIQLNNSNSFQPYAFTNYVVGNNDFSGNALTGVPTNIHVTSIDVLFKNKLQCFIQYNYTSSNQFESFPTMDTDYSNAEGQMMMEKVKRGRSKRVKRAKELARKKRDQITTVKAKLNPIIKSNEIVVPASSFEGVPKGTGLIGLDDNNDYDAPNELDIELSSNASGSPKKINTNAIILGVGIALVGIWAINKYKLIK